MSQPRVEDHLVENDARPPREVAQTILELVNWLSCGLSQRCT
jgi:hypothetical protein